MSGSVEFPTVAILVTLIRTIWPDVGELEHESNEHAVRFYREGTRWRATTREYPACVFMVEEAGDGFLTSTPRATWMQNQLHGAWLLARRAMGRDAERSVQRRAAIRFALETARASLDYFEDVFDEEDPDPLRPFRDASS